jgi:hypothetical protein
MEITNQTDEIFLKTIKYFFLLFVFIVILIIFAVVNPFELFSQYLYVTLPIIIFFMSFLISMIFLYNRNSNDLIFLNVDVNNLTTNWFFKILLIFIQFFILIFFIHLVLSAFNENFFNIFKNLNGNFFILFNISILVIIFCISSFKFGESGFGENTQFVFYYLGAIFILFFSLYFIFNTTNFNGNKYIKTFLIFFYCAISLGFLFLFNDIKDFSILTINEETINKYFFAALAFTFCSSILGIFIYLLVTSIVKLENTSTITTFILNLFILISLLGLVIRALISTKILNYLKSLPLISLFVNILLYIPHVFVNIIELLISPSGGFKGSVLPSFSLKQEYQNTTKGTIIILFITILLIIIYFSLPYLKNTNVLQGGYQLLNEPVYSNTERILGSYENLNKSDNFNYQYAISFWFYIDSSSPSSNTSYSKYTSLLNYGNKPNVKYNATTNTLMIIEDTKGGPNDISSNFKISTFETDENGMRIIYKKTDILLQKWNNIIINYNGGTLDVFYNGELVKSSVEVIPYMKLDNLSIGQNNGLNGGICNVVYFKNSLNATQIYYIYNSVKDKTPPTLY